MKTRVDIFEEVNFLIMSIQVSPRTLPTVRLYPHYPHYTIQNDNNRRSPFERSRQKRGVTVFSGFNFY